MAENESTQIMEAPEATVARAKKAAVSLQRVIASKPKPVVIRGEQFLEYEDWQLLGQFYGVAVQTHDAVSVEINGVRGAKASASLYDIHTGQIFGDVGAEAYCMEDEERWGERPWHQLASMAQTRAGSKALRNRLAWVVVLAGYRPTPAEEMQGDEKIQGQAKQQNVATDAQRRKIFATAKKMWGEVDEDYVNTTIKAIILKNFSVESTKELSKQQASDLIDMIESGKVGSEETESGTETKDMGT